MDAECAISTDVLLPLWDVSHSLASAIGRSVVTFCTGIVKHADTAVQPVLRSSPPAAGFFFGDPAAQVTSSVNLAVVLSWSPANERPLPKIAQTRNAAASISSASSSKDSKEKGYVRHSRGKGGGRK